jgi:hypothetical protein
MKGFECFCIIGSNKYFTTVIPMNSNQKLQQICLSLKV